jgi:hypothetical protein
VLEFSGRTASELHNAVRGMAGWPGSVGHFILEDPASGEGGLCVRPGLPLTLLLTQLQYLAPNMLPLYRPPGGEEVPCPAFIHLTGAREPLELKVIRTQAPTPGDLEEYTAQALDQPGVQVAWATADGSSDMLVPCGGPAAQGSGFGSILRVSMVQPPSKKAMRAKDFRNGVRQKRLLVAHR